MELHGKEEINTMIAAFRSGTGKQQLAEQYGTSVSTIERVFRQRGVRRWTVERQKPSSADEPSALT